MVGKSPLSLGKKTQDAKVLQCFPFAEGNCHCNVEGLEMPYSAGGMLRHRYVKQVSDALTFLCHLFLYLQ